MEAGRTAVELAISSAVTAGGLWTAARAFPEATAGLARAARYHSSKVSSLAGQIAADAGLKTQAFAGVPTREA
jgi:hypothetical protein